MPDYLASYVFSGLLGIFVGGAEIIPRYRDDPWAAVKCAPGILYLLLNAAASVAAMALLVYLGWIPDKSPATAATPILRVLAAGFGAMTILRSSILSVRMGDQDVPIGPGAILSVLSDALDREVDRTRAESRARSVSAVMQNVSFSRAQQALPTLSLALMQNVARGEQDKLATSLKALGEAAVHERVKRTILGLQLVNVIGADVLRKAVSAAGVAIASVESLKIESPANPLALMVNEKVRIGTSAFAANGDPLNISDRTWSVADSGTASVDALGWVTAIRAGKTTVRVSADSAFADLEIIVT